MGIMAKGLLSCMDGMPLFRMQSRSLSKPQPDTAGAVEELEGRCGGGTPWHQQQHIVQHIFSFLASSQILQAEQTCKAWRQTRAALPSEVLLQLHRGSHSHSSKAKALKHAAHQQKAWLALNFDRTLALSYQEQQQERGSQQQSSSGSSAIKFGINRPHSKRVGTEPCKQYTAAVVALMCQAWSATSLNFDSCPSLLALPGSLCGLQQLQVMRINDCSALHQLPEQTGSLGSLRRLDLQDCAVLGSLPGSMSGLSRLQHLAISGCPRLQSLPDSLCELRALQQLEIEACGLASLPNRFPGPQLTALTSLTLRGCNRLQELPDGFCQHLTLLQRLTLQLPSLPSLPADFGCMTSLVKLVLGGGVLEELPASLTRLSLLSHLAIWDCPNLELLPEGIGHLQSLKRLDLGLFKNLDALPESLGGLAGSLTRLLISGCDSLRGLPHSVGQLRQLQQLVLHNCQMLRHLPGTLGDLSGGALTSMTISGCEVLHGLPVSLNAIKSTITPGPQAAAAAAEAVAAWQD